MLVDLRVDDHARPIGATRLHAIHRQLFGKTPSDEWIQVDDGPRARS